MKRILKAAVATLFAWILLLPTIGLPFECPARIKEANQAIAAAEKEKSVKADVLSKAKELVKEAEADHRGGNHESSVKKAKEALTLVTPKK